MYDEDRNYFMRQIGGRSFIHQEWIQGDHENQLY